MGIEGCPSALGLFPSFTICGCIYAQRRFTTVDHTTTASHSDTTEAHPDAVTAMTKEAEGLVIRGSFVAPKAAAAS